MHVSRLMRTAPDQNKVLDTPDASAYRDAMAPRPCVSLTTFGYSRHAVPDADLTVDLRPIRNPHRDRRNRGLTGDDLRVRTEVMTHPHAIVELARVLTWIEARTLPTTDDWTLYVAIGCSWGVHRSRAFAATLAEALATRGYDVAVTHLADRRAPNAPNPS